MLYQVFQFLDPEWAFNLTKLDLGMNYCGHSFRKHFPLLQCFHYEGYDKDIFEESDCSDEVFVNFEMCMHKNDHTFN